MSPISADVVGRCRLDRRTDAGSVGYVGPRSAPTLAASATLEQRPWLTGLPDFASGVNERGLCVRENTGFLRAQVNSNRKTLLTTRNVKRRQEL